MVVLGVVGLAGSILSVPLNQTAWRSPQVLFLAGFTIMVIASRVLNGWFGGAPSAFATFMPAATCFYLTIAALDSLPKIRLIAAGLLLVGLYFNTLAILTYHGYLAGETAERYLLAHVVRSPNQVEESETVIRTRALGFLADPNDFAQFLMVLIPLMWVWKGPWLWNLVSIYLPGAYLLYGIYLTRSRGAVLGLAVMALVTLRRRSNSVIAVSLTAAMFFGMLAIGFTGGRGVSVSSGSDRLELWSQGLAMVKKSPLWGIGFQGYWDYAGLTAHNSFMQCLAETGLLGYSFWLALIGAAIHHFNRLMDQSTRLLLTPSLASASRTMSLAFYAFLATSWFLSRAYNQTLYLLLGLIVALHVTAAKENPAFVPFGLPRKFAFLVVGASLGSVLAFYIIVNLRLR
jgi:O-antigen ligase